MTAPSAPPSDLAAHARWPNVPAVHGWLSLDRRGGWRLKGEPVTHPGMIRFLNASYGADDDGNWFVQNGPQRVFVMLDYTPLVLHLEGDGSLAAHTGAPTAALAGLYIDEDGNVLVHTAAGAGLLDDRDLCAFAAQCRDGDDAPASDAALMAVVAGGSGVFWRGMPLQAIKRVDVPARFRFRPDPQP